MLQVLLTMAVGAVTVFVGFYFFYYAICWWSIRANKFRKKTDKNSFPTVSIIIPLYNEVKVLSRKIENLKELNYPKEKLEIVFVDGGSTDGGVELLEKLTEQSELTIKNVFQGSRKGFNNAVIEGFAETTGDIICITGAETEYDPEALNIMMRHFTDSRIGAVTGKQKIKNVDDGYSPKLEIAYRDLYDFVREGEGYIDSPFDLKGEISAARREILKALVENSELSRKGCIDACFSFQGRMDGYKTVYEPDAVYYELSPKLMRDSFKQQIRRAATLIENMLAYKNMIFNKKYGAFGMLIMPAHFLMLVILPYLFVLASIGMVVLAVLHPSNLLFLSIVVVGLLCLFLSRRVKAFVKAQIALIVATLTLLRGAETQKFERLQSARPDSPNK
jgi:cellulose synthase/poly-beta-1,6-N-acetylglucosamine synthase-like glycosyltransferase